MSNQIDERARYFAGVEDAVVFGQGQYICPGTFELEVVSQEVKPSSQDKSKILFITEYKVLSFRGTNYINDQGEKVETDDLYEAGDSVSEVVNLSDTRYGLANAKEVAAPILHAIINNPDVKLAQVLSNVTKEQMGELCTDAQPGKGKRVRCEAWHKLTKEKRKDFTVKNWTVSQFGGNEE